MTAFRPNAAGYFPYLNINTYQPKGTISNGIFEDFKILDETLPKRAL
jgi:hypothetical protein